MEKVNFVITEGGKYLLIDGNLELLPAAFRALYGIRVEVQELKGGEITINPPATAYGELLKRQQAPR